MAIPTLGQVITASGVDLEDADRDHLVRFLQEREDAIVTAIHQYAITFGLHPPIVAEVFANGGLNLGSPVDEETRALIHRRYLNHMEELRRQHGEG